MRGLIWAAALIGAMQSAHAADMPDFGPLRGALQGEASVVNWQGFYVGAQAGYGASNMNFTNSTQGLAQKLLVNTAIENEGLVSSWPLLGKVNSSGTGFGGFVGYNSQWDDVVVGLEANYLHGKFGGADSDSMTRVFGTSNGYTNDVTYQADAAIKINDIGSIRARGAYAVGCFLPYLFGAVSVGEGDISRSVTLSGMQTNPNAAAGYQQIPFSLSASDIQNAHFLWGYGAGAGVDVMLMRGVFLRAEWEYLKFAAPINTGVSTLRAGLGYKF